MRHHIVAVSALIASVMISQSSAAQQVSGRVVDDQSRNALRAASVTLLRADTVLDRTVTDTRGFFRFRVTQPGAYRVQVELIGYAAGSADFTATSQDFQLPAVVLRTQAVPLDSVVARTSPIANRAASTSVRVSSGERLKRLEEQGANIYTVIRELNSSLRLRDVLISGQRYTCVESTRRIMSLRGGCEMVAVVENGAIIGDPIRFLRQINVSDYESVEFVAPMDAALRYGMEAGSVGALVLWIRGSGPHKSNARN